MRTVDGRAAVLSLVALAACNLGPAPATLIDCPFEEPMVCGSWEWVSTSGGFAGVLMTPASEGYTQRLQLRPDSSFTLLRADSVVAEGRFLARTQQLPFPTPGRELTLTFVEGTTPGVLLLELPDPDHMTLRDLYVDGYQHDYERAW